MSSEQKQGLMAGKRGLIMGLANDKSIAWGIARAVAAQTAQERPGATSVYRLELSSSLHVISP